MRIVLDIFNNGQSRSWSKDSSTQGKDKTHNIVPLYIAAMNPRTTRFGDRLVRIDQRFSNVAWSLSDPKYLILNGPGPIGFIDDVNIGSVIY